MRRWLAILVFHVSRCYSCKLNEPIIIAVGMSPWQMETLVTGIRPELWGLACPHRKLIDLVNVTSKLLSWHARIAIIPSVPRHPTAPGVTETSLRPNSLKAIALHIKAKWASWTFYNFLYRAFALDWTEIASASTQCCRHGRHVGGSRLLGCPRRCLLRGEYEFIEK